MQDATGLDQTVSCHLATPAIKRKNGHRIFDSAVYRNLATNWLFNHEKAILHNAAMSTREQKAL
jgi:hypothetical protein